MDKQSAINIIESSLNTKFDEQIFTLFIKNLLNDIESKNNHYSGVMLWEAYREHIHAYKRIGKYTDPNGETLDVLIVEVKDTTKLDRTRTALRNFVIKHLEKFGKDNALVAFYSKQDNGSEWRFSFIKLEHQAYMDEDKGKVKIKKEFTPAKRYSFLVGENEHVYTAKNQLLPLLQNVYNNPTIEEIEAAFSIEKVTDEFFEQYKSLYIKLYEYFENDNKLQDELLKNNIDTSRFTKKLLGQIVFLYFLQKKGWLGVDKNENWGNGNKKFIQRLFDTANSKNENFFKDYLQYLFYDALAREHADEGVASFYARFETKIPFLNGGLFEADYDWTNANISIPTGLFRNSEKTKAGDIGTGVLDIFDRYNFTIKEDEPLEKEVAVDPEMLGKVFENMLDIKERKSKGAFYTPREIVHYMCQESLIHYLENILNDKATKTDIEDFIKNGHLALENDLKVVDKGNETKAYHFQLPQKIRDNADIIDEALTNIKILDPAIGSGAFPVGMLHELINAQLVLKPHLSKKYLDEKNEIIGFVANQKKTDNNRYVYRIKRHSIQKSIYGVDIDASAIDIARLRLWLSLVVDEDDLDPIETLPNLDYKIVHGNSLIGMLENTFRDFIVEQELEEFKILFYNETNEKEKKELRKKIDTKIRQLLDSAEQFVSYKIDFDFKLYFSEVWHKGGGFDIVIGNPPWLAMIGKQMQKYSKVNESKNLYIYKERYLFNSYMPNLYEFFLQKGHNLLKEKGILSFIIPDRFGFNESSKDLRDYFLSKSKIIEIAYKWDFPQIITDTMTFICQKITPPEKYSFKVVNRTKNFVMKFNISEILNDDEHMFRLYDSHEIKQLIHYIISNSIPLQKVAKSTSGFGAKSGTIFSEKTDDKQMEILKGSSIQNFIIKNSFYFEFKNSNIGGRTKDEQKLSLKTKTLIRKTGFPLVCSYDDSGRYPEQSLYFFYELTSFTSNKQLLLLFNSYLYNWFYKNYLVTNLESTPQLKNKDLDKFPFVKSDNIEIFNILADYILFLNKNKNHEILTNFYNELSNGIIFEVFFKDKFNEVKKQIIKYIDDIKPITENMSDEEKLAIIKDEFKRLYDPNHPVRNNLETLDSIEEIRIIKEVVKS